MPAPAARAPLVFGLAFGLALSGSACSHPTDTEPFPGSCAEFVPLVWQPTPNEEDVPRDTPIRITFSDYPDPDTLGGADLLLWTGVFWHTGSYSVDLMNKAVVFQPANTLQADLGYTTTLLPPLHSLSGCATSYEVRSFRTGDGVLSVTPPAPPPFSDVQATFARSCAGATCHLAPADDPVAPGACLPTPAASLSLCDGDAWNALVGVPSREVSRLNLVEPGDSAKSYLFRKLLGVPTTQGQREPPDAPLPDDELRAIAAWIDGGAIR
jgi:hypothetical protein